MISYIYVKTDIKTNFEANLQPEIVKNQIIQQNSTIMLLKNVLIFAKNFSNETI
jgi:hypothetical protein